MRERYFGKFSVSIVYLCSIERYFVLLIRRTIVERINSNVTPASYAINLTILIRILLYVSSILLRFTLL